MLALRSIAVSVEEVGPGTFEWVLLEQGIEWSLLKRANRPTATYAKAMAAGLLALQGMIDDLEAWPREEVTEVRATKRATFCFGFGGLK